MLVPNPAWMSIDMRETFILSWRSWTSWIGMVAFISYGIGALICLLRGGRLSLLGIALLYPWLFYLTEFSTIRVQEIFVLYRTYLWLPGFMLLLPLVCSTLPDKKIMLVGILVAIVLVPLSWNRLWIFADNYRLWDDAVQLLHGENRMGAQRTYYSRGYYAAKDKGDWNAAIEDFKKSLQASSSFPQVKLALAGAYAHVGRLEEARKEYDEAIALNLKNADAYYSKALFLAKLHDDAGAKVAMKQSCDLGNTMACSMISMSRPTRKH
jgi:tetratricopeptide (TPR) repeat protein